MWLLLEKKEITREIEDYSSHSKISILCTKHCLPVFHYIFHKNFTTHAKPRHFNMNHFKSYFSATLPHCDQESKVPGTTFYLSQHKKFVFIVWTGNTPVCTAWEKAASPWKDKATFLEAIYRQHQHTAKALTAAFDRFLLCLTQAEMGNCWVVFWACHSPAEGGLASWILGIFQGYLEETPWFARDWFLMERAGHSRKEYPISSGHCSQGWRTSQKRALECRQDEHFKGYCPACSP